MRALYRITYIVAIIAASLLQPIHPAEAGPQGPLAFEWTPLTVIGPDARPPLQSEPAVSVSGNAALIAWTDSRNALPDVYAAYLASSSSELRAINRELRATNRGPHFVAKRVRNPAVLAQGSLGFFAWAEKQHLFVSRLDLSSMSWISQTRVTTFNTWAAATSRPAIAGDSNGQLNLVWTDYRTAAGSARPGDIYAAGCDGTTTPISCGANIKVNDDASDANAQRNPAISRNGNQVIVVWEDTREAGLDYPRIYASISNDGGQTWGVNVRVNKRLDGSAPGPRDSAAAPAVAYAPDGSIYVAWEHRSGSPVAPADIYVARWDGSAWSMPWRVDSAPLRVRSVRPTIAASDAGVFVAWQDYRNGSANADIYTARWNGSSWQEFAAVTQPRAQTLPALGASSAQVRLVWQDERSGSADVYTAVWNGSAWNNLTLVNTNPPRLPYQMYPALASSGGQVWALLTDQRAGYTDLYLARMVSSTQWTTLMPLPTQASQGGSVDVGSGAIAFTSDGRLHAVWSDYHYTRGTRPVYAVLSNTTWTPPILLSAPTTNTDRLATIAAFGNTLAAAWSRNNNSQSNVYVTWNTGAGWVTETAVLTTPINTWRIPFAVAVDHTNIYVAWRQPGNGSVLMFARRSLSGAGGWSYSRIDQNQNVSWCVNTAPALKAGPDGALHVAWSGCLRRNPANNWPLDGFALYATSNDQGATWSAPLRLAQTVANNRDGRTQPALAVSPSGRALAVFPALSVNNGAFVAAMVQSGALAFTHTIHANAGWRPADTYDGVWYEGDSAGSVAFDPVTQRFVVAMIDRSSGRAPRVLTATYGDTASVPRAFIPIVKR